MRWPHPGRRQRSIENVGWLGTWLLILLPAVAHGEPNVWTQLLDTGQAEVRAIAIDPTDSLTIYAATFSEGIYKTTNGGADWASINTATPARYTIDFVIDPVAPNKLYAGGRDENFRQGLVWKSTDGGASWTEHEVRDGPLYDNAISKLAVDPRGSAVAIYAGTLRGVFKSTDEGDTWVYTGGLIDSETGYYSRVESLAIDPTNPDILYAGTNYSVFRSLDGANTWTQTTLASIAVSPPALSIAIDPANPMTVYVGTWGSSGYPGARLFKTVDGGNSWTAAGCGLSRDNEPVLYVTSLAVDPTEPALVYAGGCCGGPNGVYRSLNGGSTWSPLSGLYTLHTPKAVALDPSNPKKIYAASLGVWVLDSVPPSSEPGDSDGDGLSDVWETRGVDSDCDAVIDYALPGADPMHKDLYVEVDAMVGLGPQAGALDSVVAAFARAPVSNPDGTEGINLHIVGEGCDPCVDETDIPVAAWADPPWVEFDVLKQQRFGTAAEQALPDWPSSAKREAKLKAFRYCVFGRSWGPSSQAGRARTIPGNACSDFIVTMGHPGWGTVTRDEHAGLFMHELGHALGLRHGGVDEALFKANYKSVMNYLWQIPSRPGWVGGLAETALANYRSSWRLDYSRETLNSFTENSLSEPAGFGGDANFWAPVGPAIGATNPAAQLVRMGGPVDWNRNGDTTELGVKADVDYLVPLSGPSFPYVVAAGGEDWPRIQYLPPDASGGAEMWPLLTELNAVASEHDSLREMTATEFLQLSGMRFDCNGNGTPDDEEIEGGLLPDVNENGIPDDCENLAAVDVPPVPPRGLGIQLRIRGNPASGRAAQGLAFSIPRVSRVTVRVYDVGGALITTLLDRELGAGGHQVVWRGRNATGHAMASGIYFAEVVSGAEREVAKLIRLR